MVYGDLVYGQACVYGGDLTCDPPGNNTACDVCGQGWRIEATHLHTGVVKAVLLPTTARWEEEYSRPGRGSMSASVIGPAADDSWAHTTGIFISQVFPDGTRRARFGGYAESFEPDPDIEGLFQIGLQPMDEYPTHQFLADEDAGIAYTTPEYVDADNPGPGKSQTEIALDMLNYATAGLAALPLSGVAGPSNHLRVRAWTATDFKNLGQAISELVDEPDGLTYRLEHQFFENPARWETIIRYDDELNTVATIPIREGVEAWGTTLSVDGKDQAGRVYGIGAGTGTDLMFSVAYDADGSLPEFRKTVAWKDQVVPEALDSLTIGAVTRYRDPATTPAFTLMGLHQVTPEQLRIGDIITPEIGYGVYTFRGEQARVVGQAWELTVGKPVTRAVTLEPVIRPSLSVKTQTPAVAPQAETPEQGENPPPETPIEPPVPSLPSQVLDLTNWKLTLATGSEGDPDEIKQPQLASYSHPDWFHTTSGPAVLFRVPQDGVTTPNSKNTRTELREMRNGGKDNASWSSGTMEAVLAFTELPPGKPHVVAMQIHDKDDDVSVLRLEGTDLWTTNGDNTHGTKIMSGYQLGTFIKVKVVAGGGTIRWFLNDSEVASLSKSVSGGYFKAGAYQQAGNSGSGFGEVIFKSLVVTH